MEKHPPSNQNEIDEILPILIEKADNGCFDSQIEIMSAFDNEKSEKITVELVRKYENEVLKTTNFSNLKLAIYWNRGIHYRDLGDYDNMVEQFHKKQKTEYQNDLVPS